MFARNGVTKFAGTAIVAGALGLAAFTTAGTAAAMSSADDNFLSRHQRGGHRLRQPAGRDLRRPRCLHRHRRRRRPRRPRHGDHGRNRSDHRPGRDLRRLRGRQFLPRAQRALRIAPLPARGPCCGGVGPRAPFSDRRARQFGRFVFLSLQEKRRDLRAWEPPEKIGCSSSASE